MSLLQRRVFLELLGNCVISMVLLLAVLVLVASVEIVASVQGLTALHFLKTVPVFLAVSVDLVLPLSVLVAVVMTFGRLAADNEVDTLRASGISPWTLLVPGLVFGALSSLLLLQAMDYGKPWAEREKRRVVRDIPLAEVLSRSLASGEPVAVDDSTIVSAESIDEGGRARNLRIQVLGDGGVVVQEVLAQTADIFVDLEASTLVLTLHDFRWTVGGATSGKDWTIERPLDRSYVDLRIPQLTTPQLLAWLERKPEQRGMFKENSVRLAADTRLAGAASCLVFVILGMPVALRFRRSDRVGAFLVAFLLALFVYYPSVRITKALAERELVPAAVAAWSGNGLLVLVGLAFGRKALRR